MKITVTPERRTAALRHLRAALHGPLGDLNHEAHLYYATALLIADDHGRVTHRALAGALADPGLHDAAETLLLDAALDWPTDSLN